MKVITEIMMFKVSVYMFHLKLIKITSNENEKKQFSSAKNLHIFP